MNRQERDYSDRYNYGSDRSRGYDRSDEHYHDARNLTNEFEINYRGDRYNDPGNYNRRTISYHETNDPENMYERRMEDAGHFRWYSDVDNENRDLVRRFSRGLDSGHDTPNPYNRDTYDYSRDRSRYSNYQDDYRSYQNMDESNRDRYSNVSQSNIRQGYGISGYGGTSDRYNTLNSDWNRGGAADERSYYSGSGESRFGGGMGESFPGSNRGVPDTTYGHGNYYRNEGTGMGSTYGGSNYGGGTGYMGGHRGGSSGNQTYGTSSGNYGGSGSTGSGSYGGRSGFGRDSTSYNSGRGSSEFGGL